MPEMLGGCLCGQVRYSANAEPAHLARRALSGDLLCIETCRKSALRLL